MRNPLVLAGVALLSLAILALLWWQLGFGAVDGPTVRPPDAAPPEELQAKVPALPGPGPAAGPEAERREVANPGPKADAAPTDKSLGSLLVRVIYGDDKSPAEGIQISLQELVRDGPRPPFRRKRSDKSGQVEFDRLQPGNVVLLSDRSRMDYKTTKVVAGSKKEFVFELKDGIVLRGVVVDRHGLPVSGADIVLCEWAGIEARTVAQTDERGRFRLRQVGTTVNVGARARGHAPSPLRTVMAGKGAEVEVEIRLPGPGGSVHGQVLGPDGEPVADCEVVVGKLEPDHRGITLPDGSKGMYARSGRTRTDATGHFELFGLPPGDAPTLVRANRLAPHIGTVQVRADAATAMDVRLAAGVVCTGTVRDDDGKPLRRVEVTFGRDYYAPDRRATRTLADGTYRLEGLPAGDIEILAKNDALGQKRSAVRAAAGQTVSLDIVLSRGLVLAGTITDQDGKPIKEAQIQGRGRYRKGDKTWWAYVTSDANGRFELINCPTDEKIQLEVQKSAYAPLRQNDVDPHVGRIALQMTFEGKPTAQIVGTVLDPDGKPVNEAQVSARSDQGDTTGIESTSKDGKLRLHRLRGGEYRLQVSSGVFPTWRSPPHRIENGATWDVGTIQLQRGGRVRVRPEADAAVGKFNLYINEPDGNFVTYIDPRKSPIRSDPLAPGTYVLWARGDKARSPAVSITIRAGEETDAVVRVRPAVACDIELVPGESTESLRRVAFVLTGPGGDLLRSTAFRGDGKHFRYSTAMLPGSHTLEVQHQGKSVGRTTFEIAPTDQKRNIRLELR
ncbi:MAG: carboxypeptidase regulatory-like domain-containing protein [Planctomycetes bacterium]|nr:carboxypeptidase regulatory-like domain-containing protein [Planctomycetota bacterium]